MIGRIATCELRPEGLDPMLYPIELRTRLP